MLNTKMTKYDAYKNSGVEWLGEIPTEWELIRLGTRFKERKEKVSDTDYPPLSVTKNGIVPQLANAAKTNDGDNRKLVRSGDFVINSRSDRKGASGISDSDGSVSLINIILEPQDITPRYCHYLLKSYSFIEEFYRMGHGIVADLWTTRYDEMKAVMMGIPPRPEQKAIADFLDRKTMLIDQAVAIKQKQVELLKERKQILIQNAVTHGLNPDAPMRDSGVEWIGEIPKHWEVKRLASFGLFSKGGGFSKSSLTPNGVPAVLYGDIYTKYEYTINNVKRKISPLVARNSVQLHSGDLLFTGSGETKEDIGKCVVFNSDEKAVAGGDIIIFKQNVNHSLFMSYCLNTHGIIEQKAKASKGEIIVHIYASKLRNLYVPMPRLPEQTAIVAHIEKESAKIDQAIALNQQQIEKLKEYKATLINSAVTGKIKIPGKLEAVS